MSLTIDDSRKTGTGDVVLREVWRAKDELSASYGYSLDKLFAITREHEKHSGHRIVNFQKKQEGSAVSRSR